jgi:uncharacterized RDD family membrane protein YckC
MSTTGPTRRTSIFLGEPPTSLFSRFSAKAIDLIIVAALFFLGQTIWAPLGVFVSVLFCALQDGMGMGQSVGKRIIGLCVVDAGGNYPCSFHSSISRNLPFIAVLVFSAHPLLWVLLCLVALPVVGLEVYLLFCLPTGVRVGDILGNTRVTEYIDESLPGFQNG